MPIQSLTDLSRPFFQAFAESVPDTLTVLDLAGKVVFINRAPAGLTVDDVVGTNFFDYLPQGDQPPVRACFAQVLDTQAPGAFPSTYKNKAGERTQWQSRVGALVGDTGVMGFVVTSTDVTERRRAVAERERLYEMSLDLLTVAGFDGMFRRVSPAFVRVLGHSVPQLLETPFMDFVAEADRPLAEAALARALQGEEVHHLEVRLRTADGQFRTVEWHIASDPEAELIFGTGRDVTEIKELRTELAQAQKMAALGQLAGGLAHQFNNLLQAASLGVDFARRSSGGDRELRAVLDELDAAHRRASELSQGLLSFSRQVPLAQVPINLNRLVTETEQQLRTTLPANIALDVTVTGALSVLGDKRQLQQVLQNLLANAQEAMPDGGRLSLALEGTQQRALLRVSDTGRGISAVNLGRVFEPFFTTKSPGQATGLGLAVAQAVVERHGGTIRVQSEQGTGSTFEVSLPLMAVAPTASPPQPAAQASATGGERLLVVDDEPLVRRSITRMLIQAGYQVLEATQGAEALAMLQQPGHGVALAIVDLTMPVMGGLSLLKHLRQERIEVPVVLVSGYAVSPEPLPPGVPLLTKPFQRDQLLGLIRQKLGTAVRGA